MICPGNPGSKEIQDWLYSLGSAKSNCHFVRGDFDEAPGIPEQKVINIGNFKIGIIHGHQVLPWGDSEALSAIQRELDCDILVSGHTHQHSITTNEGKYFINPGSGTGAYSALAIQSTPSFILMAIQGDDVSAFVYQKKEDAEKPDVSRIDFTRHGSIV